MKTTDMTGKVFGPWTVISLGKRPDGSKEKGAFWLCQCVCGNTHHIPGTRLRAGRYGRGCKSCSQHGHTKNRRGSPTYNSWRAMRERCFNPNNAAYYRYGGRGITVCPEWKESFETFLSDMGNRPKGCTLDRIDGDGNYEMGNCRWADAKTQARNSSHFRLSDEQIEAILNLIDAGARQSDIATACSISRGHIANIARGHARYSKDEDVRAFVREYGL